MHHCTVMRRKTMCMRGSITVSPIQVRVVLMDALLTMDVSIEDVAISLQLHLIKLSSFR